MKGAKERHIDEGLQVIGIGIQDSEENIHDYAKKLKMTWPVGYDVGDRISKAYGITFGAGIVFIDRGGIIQKRAVKAFSEAEMERSLELILAPLNP